MGKYDALCAHLKSLAAAEWDAPFSEIQSILGFMLPVSAERHRAWWANHGGAQVHQNSWLDAGWIVDHVDMGRRLVRFRKLYMAGKTRRPGRPAGRSRRDAGSHGDQKYFQQNSLRSLSLRLEWSEHFPVERRADAGFTCSGLPDGAAIVRIHLIHDQKARVLLMETLSLPDILPSLQDAFDGPEARYAAEIDAALTRGDKVMVDAVCSQQAWMIRDGRGVCLDLTEPLVRSFLMSAIQMDADLNEQTLSQLDLIS